LELNDAQNACFLNRLVLFLIEIHSNSAKQYNYRHYMSSTECLGCILLNRAEREKNKVNVTEMCCNINESKLPHGAVFTHHIT